MIKILNESKQRLGNIKNVITASRIEEINGENTLDFTAVLDAYTNSLIGDNSMFELDDEYFDVAYFKKDANQDGTFIVEIESEHISYRLNDPDLNVEYFTEMGTPTYILSKILEDTPFTIGIVEFTNHETYSAQEAKSRRQLLMEFVAYLDGEVIFNKNEISIVQHRGSTAIKPLIKGKHINIINQSFNKREKNKNGEPLLSYSCEYIHRPGDVYNIGDEVLLIHNDLNIKEHLRVIKIQQNPYNVRETTMVFANYDHGLEDKLYRMETEAVNKDALMNGIRIGPKYGFEAVRNDKRARSYFKSDGMALQAGDGEGNYVDKLYYAYDSETHTTDLVYDGTFSANAINAMKANIDIIISNTTIVQNLYAEYGRIANLTVSELDTSWKKITNYLAGDTSDVNYSRHYEQYSNYITASTDGSETIQLRDSDDHLLYWVDNTNTGMTKNETEYPVLTYVYDEHVKFQITFEEGGNKQVVLALGVGFGYSDPNAGKGFIYKGSDGMRLKYIQGDSREVSLCIGDAGVTQRGSTRAYGIRNIAEGITPPSNPQDGDLWIDVSVPTPTIGENLASSANLATAVARINELTDALVAHKILNRL